jgi:hypothetical protein
METHENERRSRRHLKFRVVPGSFAICRLAAGSPIPDWALHGTFSSLTRTEEELSIVCESRKVPPEANHHAPWICLQLEGPFPFSETGILTSFIDPLAEVGVPIFAISTYDTDYVLIREDFADIALSALQSAGHQLIGYALPGVAKGPGKDAV